MFEEILDNQLETEAILISENISLYKNVVIQNN